MITIQVTEDEAEMLTQLLGWILSDLRMEISDTDRVDFREGLKIEKRVLEKVIEQLQVTAGA